MKSFLVIGMGRFGRHLALALADGGSEVMIIDKDEARLTDLIPAVTSVQIGDCTQEAVLRQLGVGNFDICFVCVGENFQCNLEITSLLKDLGAKRVVSKISRDRHAKFLLRNGADEVVYPERMMAEKLAVMYSKDHLLDYFEVSEDISIYEIEPMQRWIGKTIREVNFRAKYHASILATKKGETVTVLPSADYVFAQGERLMIVGRDIDLEKILKQLD